MVAGPTGTAINGSGSAQSTPARPQSPPQQLAPTPMKKKKKAAPPAIDTDIEPPPRNPARPSPSSPRAAGTLHKQPSVVREDPEGEEAESNGQIYRPKRSTTGTAQRSSSIATSAGPAIAYVAPNPPHARSVSLDIPRSQGNVQTQSGNMLRPPHAHFSSSNLVDTLSGFKHDPPPRSISPAKSALKTSPAPSLRASSPIANTGATGPIPPPSETSDNNSVASQDAVKPSKKRQARVSFDDAATTVVEPSPSTPSFPRVGNARPLSPSYAGVNGEDESMVPRPALPSFGSVRSPNSRNQPQMAEKVTETLPSSTSTSQSTLADHRETSSDNAIGAILANDQSHERAAERAAEQAVTNEPLPPQVTSVEGSGDQSDPEHDGQEDEFLSKDASGPASNSVHDVTVNVPNITVLPATPGLGEDVENPIESPKAAQRFSVPGSWDDEEETEADSEDEYHGATPTEGPQALTMSRLQQLDPINESDSDDSAAFSDAAEDLSDLDEGGFASLDAIVESPMVKVPATAAVTEADTPTKPDRSTTNDETPMRGANGDWTEATAYWSSLSKKHKEQLEKQTAASENTPPPVVGPPKAMKKKVKPAVSQAPTPASTAPGTVRQRPPAQDVSQTQAQPRPSAMKKSMRGPAAPASSSGEETHMRTSMRTGGPMKTSMRDSRGPAPSQTEPPEPRGALQKKDIRPASTSNGPSPGRPSSVAAPKTLQSQAGRKSAAPVVPTPAKMNSNDSDSESSFKKKRRTSVSTMDSVGHYTMKRSMRAASVDMAASRRPTSPTAAPSSSRWSVRSMSPPAPSGRKAESIRASLRGPAVDDTPTMRGKNSRARDSKSPTRFTMSGFSKSSKQAPAPTVAKAKPAFRSRFGDSDSEDDAPKGPYRSRFADSDDEDDSPVGPPRHVPADLTPVRGIPRRNQDGDDSTDLDDSDDEGGNTKKASTRGASRVKGKPIVPSQSDIDQAMEQARRNVAAMTGNAELAAPTTPQKAKESDTKHVRLETQPQTNGQTNGPTTNGTIVEPSDGLNRPRRGLMGSIFGRRRTSSTATIPTMASQGIAKDSAPTSPKAEVIGSPQSPQTPRSGRLQRRNTPQLQRTGSEMSTAPVSATGSQSAPNWPLPVPPPIPESTTEGLNRPNTSDGVGETDRVKLATSMRPQMSVRSQSGISAAKRTAEENAIYSARTGKKKKFSRLRRAFGLND